MKAMWSQSLLSRNKMLVTDKEVHISSSQKASDDKHHHRIPRRAGDLREGNRVPLNSSEAQSLQMPEEQHLMIDHLSKTQML